MRKKGIISIVICFILGTLGAAAQSLDKVVEDYIRKNKVVTASPGDTAIRKTGNPFLIKHSSGVKTLTVPKGAIKIPMPTGTKDVSGKFYSPYVSSNVDFIVSVEQMINGKKETTAIKGGDIRKGSRTRVDVMVDYSDYTKASLYYYFLSGVVSSAPFTMTGSHTVKIVDYNLSEEVLNQDIPALLVYEDNGEGTQQDIIKKMQAGEGLSPDLKKHRHLYKQLGNHCIVYYKLIPQP